MNLNKDLNKFTTSTWVHHTMSQDTLLKFMFENVHARGELVEIPHTWQHVLQHQNFPTPIQKVLGELCASAVLLTANLKFDGTLVMQIHGDGPVKLLVVECDEQLRLRATAKIKEGVILPDSISLSDMVNTQGQGRFVITLDPRHKLPGQTAYQGVVPLDGHTIATIIENYMMRSEQLDTKLWLAADATMSRGLLLQKLPDVGGYVGGYANDKHAAIPHEASHINPTETNASSNEVNEANEAIDTWQRIGMLGDTLKEDELLHTDVHTLLKRLFWEEAVRVFAPIHPSFHCSCTREKVGNMLKMLGTSEVEQAIAELGQLHIHCDFCGKLYAFDKVDCAQLFSTDNLSDGVHQGHSSKH